MTVRRVVALWGIVPIAAVLYFFIFWHWFEFWRKHRVLTYTLMASVIGGTSVALVALRHVLLVRRFSMPGWLQVLGWIVIVGASVFGFVADRQIGIRIRSFMPFFDPHAHIKLRTTGAYGVVRHPIYAAGWIYQLGTFLVAGYPAILVACVVYSLGAIWFTRQEEERLMALLDDPQEYVRYRARVSALFPRIRRSSA